MENNEHLLKIYKASAGSGKTFRLTMEFLKYVIEDPTCYERVLAVTFTNKATAEMKMRIVSTLYGIANDLEESQGDIATILREMGEKDAKFRSHTYIVAQAKIALSLMLHNFSNFHIETIDSFFQSVLRNLEKELGLGTHLNLELEVKPLLSEAVETLLDRITEEDTLRCWVSRFISDQIDSEKGWNISDKIAKFSENLFSEQFRLRSKKMFDLVKSDESSITVYLDKICEEKKKRNDGILLLIKQFQEFNIEHGYTIENYYRKTYGLYGYIDKLAHGKTPNSKGEIIASIANREESPFKKGVGSRQEEEYVLSILDGIEKNREFIREIEYIEKNFFCVGLISFVEKYIREINDEMNQFILADTQILLNDMIEDSDAPFIYEKIGTYLDHIMIDEFQDTSETQWSNFKPLILECASRRMDSLIVGDQKQSIYRFRNGNWQLLGNLSDEMAQISPRVEPLDTNWRSESRIVEFNNYIFEKMPVMYEDGKNNHPLLASMIQAYKDASQKCKKAEKAERGYVKAQFFEKKNVEEYKESVLRALSDEIRFFQQKGVKPEQMAILVDKKDYIADIAEYFASYKMEEGNQGYCFDLISENAYKLDASETVQCIVSAMQYIALHIYNTDGNGKKQDSDLAMVQLLRLYESVGRNLDESTSFFPNPRKLTDDQIEFLESINRLSMLPLYEMVEEIYRVMRLERIPEQESYYCFFLDKINEFLTKKSSDLSIFLHYWDDYLHEQPISSGEASGIKVMTIHKSKGLEFQTVLIPFCDWGLKYSPQKTNYLWETTESLPSPLNTFPLVAIKKVDDLSSSYFSDSFYKEEVEEYMDKLNLLYVALTRAEKNMSIFGMLKSETKGKEEKEDTSVSHRLVTILKYSEFGNWDDDNNIFLSGEVDVEEETTKFDTKNPFKRSPNKLSFNCLTYTQKGKFRQSNKSNDFIEDNDFETTQNEYIDKGKLLHYLFSKISTADDIEKVVNQMEFEGLFESVEQKRKILSSVRKAMETEEAQRWFRPGLKLYNECSILYRDENGDVQVRRPDRVICEGNHMTVVDFKFGKKSPKYQKQIDEYVDLLERMGYQADGHIWYLNDLFS
mgnify:CR=1 FL=1